MLNGDLAFQSAERLRDRLLLEQPMSSGNNPSLGEELSHSKHDHKSLVEQLFLIALSRHPSPAEVERIVPLLNSPAMNLPDRLLVACVAILNSSEFVYVD
jgi:hypothetical protein